MFSKVGFKESVNIMATFNLGMSQELIFINGFVLKSTVGQSLQKEEDNPKIDGLIF